MGEAKRRYEAGLGFARELITDADNPHQFSTNLVQDVEPILDGIARDRDNMRHGVNKVAARLPMVIVEDLMNRGIWDDEDAMKKWLNSYDAAPWRIWKGRV
jgi:hypothetical protein